VAERPQSWYEDIKRRFADERDLRLAYRPEGTAQYTSDLDGPLARFALDPTPQRPSRVIRLRTRSTPYSSAAGFPHC